MISQSVVSGLKKKTNHKSTIWTDPWVMGQLYDAVPWRIRNNSLRETMMMEEWFELKQSKNGDVMTWGSLAYHGDCGASMMR